MKRTLLSLLFCVTTSIFAQATNYGFVENKGQWDTEIKFKCDLPGGYLLLKSTSIEYLFYDTKKMQELHATTTQQAKQVKVNPRITLSRVKLNFNHENTQTFRYLPSQPKAKKTFFLTPNSSTFSEAKTFSEIRINDIYPNIDFRIYTINETLKFEYIVHPSGNPKLIQLEYEGAKEVKIEENELKIQTEVNIFKEFNPYSFQKIANKTQSVSTKFQKKEEKISFELGDYDTTKELIIDPELIFSTYSGSASDNWSHSATYDLNGNLYAAGTIFGPSFSVTANAFQDKLNNATRSTELVTDLLIIKYDSDGKNILYSTYLGGNNSEVPHSLIVNSKNQLIIFGTTSSNNFPTSQNAFSKKFNGGTPTISNAITSGIYFENGSDIFVSIISEDGSKLIGSTYIGGSGDDGINDSRSFSLRNYGDEFRGEVYVNSEDHIFVGSTTTSSNFPVTNGSKHSGKADGVVFELNQDASKLLWSSYFGGNENDAIYGIRVTKNQEIYVCGATQSTNLATKTAFRNQFEGNSEGFITKFQDNKTKHLTSYLGTSDADISLFIDLDEAENIYILGLSKGEYPVSEGVYRNEKSGQYIQCLDKNLEKSIFSTTFGSGRGKQVIDIVPTAFNINDCGNIYLAGWGGKVNINTGINPSSSTKNLPVTKDAIQLETTGSNYYFMILEANARSLLFGSYFGSAAPPAAENERGDHLDGGTCRFDKKGFIYHSACVCKVADFVSFPLKNAISSTHNSTNCNMVAFKFSLDALEAQFSIQKEGKIVTEICTNEEVVLKNNSQNAKSYEWFLDGKLFSRLENPQLKIDKNGLYKLKLIAYNPTTCLALDSTFQLLNVVNFTPYVTKDSTICTSKSIILEASGGTKYEWTPKENLSDATSSRPLAKISETTTFTVTISNEVCSAKKSTTLSAEAIREDFKISKGKEICKGDIFELELETIAPKFKWILTNGIDSLQKKINIKPLLTTSYKAIVTYSDGCEFEKDVVISLDNQLKSDFNYTWNYGCKEPPKLIVTNTSTNSTSSEWLLSEEILSTENQPIFKQLPTNGTLPLQLRVTNKNGCAATSEQLINFDNSDGMIPNVISPNNDSLNDVFKIGFPNVDLKIYNRWGKEIYSSKNYENNWGNGVEAGTYFYTVELQNGETCKGYINVVN